MEIENGVKVITENHLDKYSMWRFDDITRRYYPIRDAEEVPERSCDLFVRATFYAPNNLIFKGCLVGVIDIYCIFLFYNETMFIFNKNMIDICFDQFNKLIENMNLNKNILIADIFPLKYETTIDLEGFRNISGEFDAFEKLKDKRLLRWKNI